MLSAALLSGLPPVATAAATAVEIAPVIGPTASTVPAGVPTNDVFFTNTIDFTFSGGHVILSTCANGSCPIVADDAIRLSVPGGSPILFPFYTHEFRPADVTSLFHLGSNTVTVELIDLMGPQRGSSHPFYLVPSATAPPPGLLRIEPAPHGTEFIGTLYNGHTRDPINSLTGSYTYQFTDTAIAGRGPTIDSTRSYNSNDTRLSPLGPGWTHSYNAHLADPGGGSADVILVEPEGRSDVYSPTSGGSYRPPPGTHTSLAKNTDGTYTATHKDQTSWTFDATGNLIRISDRFGNLSLLHYDAGRLVAVDDPAGRGQLTLKYDDAKQRLVEIRGWGGRLVSYDYDSNNRLSKVTDREGNPTAYAYDGASQRLVSITDARGNIAVTNTYDGDGRVSSQKDARGLLTGAVTSLSYANGPGGTKTTTVAYPAAAFEPGWLPQIIDKYDNKGRLVSRTSKPTSNDAEWATETYGYNDAFDLTSSTDGDGHTTNLCYDVDPSGSPITGSGGNLTRRIDPAPEANSARPVSLFVYDDKDNVIQTLSPRGVNAPATVGCGTNLLGQLNMGFATDYGYDAASKTRLESVHQRFTDPVAGLTDAITRYEYGDLANLLSDTSV